MIDLANKFSRGSNENLLQLWQGRDQLNDDDINPLRDELELRGLQKQVEEIADRPSARTIYGDLPQGPQTFLYLSVPFWWIRELWLRYKTKDGQRVEATITMTRRTGSIC
jgi:hypothetical protein